VSKSKTTLFGARSSAEYGFAYFADITLDPAGLQKLATELKKRCGCGGTVNNGVIEIQGDHRSLLLEILSKRWQTNLSGG
jgi:translation initiation factor 1